jgi:hypothetical protein
MNGSGHRSFILPVVALACTLGAVACQSGPSAPPGRAKTVARASSAGDVALDSATQTVNAHWLTDSNVVALLGLVDQRQAELARAELQSWGSDTVEALALGMSRAYAAQQQSLDSLAGALHIRPAFPAVGVALDTSLQQRVATLQGLGAARLDSAFLRAASVQDAWAANYLDQLSAVATSPEVAAFAAKAANRATLQLNAIQQFLTLRTAALATTDSTAADSTRRKRANAGTNR